MRRPLTFWASVLEESKKPLVHRKIEIRSDLGPGQVLVRISFSGLCGAQLNEIDAAKGPDKFLPHLLGHEGFGEVLEVGPLVNHVEIGQMVVLHWMEGLGVQSATPSYYRDDQVVNAGWVTTFNELAIVSANRCTPVSTDLPEKMLPLFGCGATTAAGVVGKEAQVRLGESVVVLGTGGVGLLSIIAARAAGAIEIVGVDLADSRLDAAYAAGATAVFKSSKTGTLVDQIIAKIGHPPQVVIETSGAKAMIELAYRLGQPAGKVVLVGVPNVNDPAVLETLQLHFGMSFTGSRGGSTKPEIDIPNLIKAAERGIFPVQQIPITTFPLSSINDAIDAVRDGAPGRMVIECQS